MNYYDEAFLDKLDRVKVKKQYIEITLLSFEEKEIRTITGTILSGSISVNGSSRIRRTINLTMVAQKEENNLTNLDNLISLNKKVRVRVGYNNPFKEYWDEYGQIVWFLCGTYVVSNASVSSSPTSCTISIQGKDKMAMLDGTAGGTLPASVNFNEIYQYNKDGSVTVLTPTIFNIIQEAVNHYGLEPINNIVINDIPNRGKKLIRYVGSTPLYFSSDYTSIYIGEFNSTPEKPTPFKADDYVYGYGDDVGYMDTDFTYPGDLIFAAGSTVMQVLDEICKVLGNYEFFYDTEGRFIFQEIKNYTYNKYSIVVGDGTDSKAVPLTELKGSYYLKSTISSKYQYTFTDTETVSAITNNPKYSNIKNDFIVWGQRESITGSKHEIRYHLAIDEKPANVLCKKYMYEQRADEQDLIVNYVFTDKEKSESSLHVGNYTYTLIGPPLATYEWREELYRRALTNTISNAEEGYYDAELIAEWRKLYDPTNKEWKGGWNPKVQNSPNELDYWLDFIDNAEELNGYSISAIGRRTKVINDTKIKSIYNNPIPAVLFIPHISDDDGKYNDELIRQAQAEGVQYCYLTGSYLQYFALSTTSISCYEKIRELIDTYLIYQTSISITSLPKYYLEPNTLIYVEDKVSGVAGDFMITQFSLPLQYSGTMSITATQALSRV